MKNKKLETRINKLKRIIIPILKKNKIIKAGVFGSFVREDYKKGSDIDILIEVKAKKFSLFDLVGLKMELEKKLNKKIDLLTYKGIHPYLRESILADEVRII